MRRSRRSARECAPGSRSATYGVRVSIDGKLSSPGSLVGRAAVVLGSAATLRRERAVKARNRSLLFRFWDHRPRIPSLDRGLSRL